MRLSFPNNEHADVLVADGDTSIGAAQDNAVVLDRPEVAAHHVSVELSERSIVLHVLDTAARVHVNARPVRSMAILHLGDIVSLGTTQMLLKPDRDDSIRVHLPAKGSAAATPDVAGDDSAPSPAKVVLRGVSGAYFGRSIPVDGHLVIGSGDASGLVLDETGMEARHAQIENVGDSIYLRDLGSANGTCVNGVRVRDAVLFPDDQLAFDQNRFLLEAPGLPMRDSDEGGFQGEEPNITQTLRAIPSPPAQPADAAPDSGAAGSVNRSLWWLVGVAAVIAVGLVVFFARA